MLVQHVHQVSIVHRLILQLKHCARVVNTVHQVKNLQLTVLPVLTTQEVVQVLQVIVKTVPMDHIVDQRECPLQDLIVNQDTIAQEEPQLLLKMLAQLAIIVLQELMPQFHAQQVHITH